MNAYQAHRNGTELECGCVVDAHRCEEAQALHTLFNQLGGIQGHLYGRAFDAHHYGHRGNDSACELPPHTRPAAVEPPKPEVRYDYVITTVAPWKLVSGPMTVQRHNEKSDTALVRSVPAHVAYYAQDMRRALCDIRDKTYRRPEPVAQGVWGIADHVLAKLDEAEGWPRS